MLRPNHSTTPVVTDDAIEVVEYLASCARRHPALASAYLECVRRVAERATMARPQRTRCRR